MSSFFILFLLPIHILHMFLRVLHNILVNVWHLLYMLLWKCLWGGGGVDAYIRKANCVGSPLSMTQMHFEWVHTSPFLLHISLLHISHVKVQLCKRNIHMSKKAQNFSVWEFGERLYDDCDVRWVCMCLPYIENLLTLCCLYRSFKQWWSNYLLISISLLSPNWYLEYATPTLMCLPSWKYVIS